MEYGAALRRLILRFAEGAQLGFKGIECEPAEQFVYELLGERD